MMRHGAQQLAGEQDRVRAGVVRQPPSPAVSPSPGAYAAFVCAVVCTTPAPVRDAARRCTARGCSHHRFHSPPSPLAPLRCLMPLSGHMSAMKSTRGRVEVSHVAELAPLVPADPVNGYTFHSTSSITYIAVNAAVALRTRGTRGRRQNNM